MKDSIQGPGWSTGLDIEGEGSEGGGSSYSSLNSVEIHAGTFLSVHLFVEMFKTILRLWY
jgi:hypothetical protein